MVINNGKPLYRQALLSTGTGTSVSKYWRMLQLQHQGHVLAPRLSATQNFRSRRLVSRFRRGCHGLHVNTSNLAEQKINLYRELRFHLVCGSILIFHTILQDCARNCLSERLKKEGKKTGVLKTSCRLRSEPFASLSLAIL